jgi:uncharacterized protein
MTTFANRVQALPRLGIGVSTEYGAFRTEGALDLMGLVTERPQYAQFLEIGVETSKGLDSDAQAWIEQGRATTYHFLDVNLDDPRDLDGAWLEDVRALTEAMEPAWMCGDAGLWHFGRRERGHMLLLPPILSDESARAMADGIIALRDAIGFEVLPENPPGHAFVGDLHLLDFFARVCELADTGMLLDAAHLAIYQRSLGYDELTALDGFPLERVVEMHVAGASTMNVDGLQLVEDDHTVNVLPETWRILETVGPSAENLKAVVFECERNPIDACLPGFQRIAETLNWHSGSGEERR